MKKIIAIITLTLLIIGCSEDGGGAESSTTYTLTQVLMYLTGECSGNNYIDMAALMPEQTITINDNGTLDMYMASHCDDITITTQSECETEMTCGDNDNEQCEWNAASTETLPYTQNGTSITIIGLDAMLGEGLTITLSGDTMTWTANADGMCMQMIYENI